MQFGSRCRSIAAATGSLPSILTAGERGLGASEERQAENQVGETGRGADTDSDPHDPLQSLECQ